MKINLKHIFPEVTCEGSISIDGNKIKYKLPNSFYNGELDIENLQYAYLIVKPESQAPHSPVLALSAPYLYRIPVNFKGFKEAYELLSARYDFDNDAFFRHLKSNEKIRKQIWRRVHETNFTIIHDNNFSDIDKGFTILSPEKDFILKVNN